MFSHTKCRAYTHGILNNSKGVIRSNELAMATAVTNIRRTIIRKGGEQIQTNTSILTFNQPHTHKVKIGYCLERVETYVPTPLRCFKCQKYRQHKEAYKRRQTCEKCSEKDLDHMEEDSLKEIRCSNCRQDYPDMQDLVMYIKRKGKYLK